MKLMNGAEIEERPCLTRKMHSSSHTKRVIMRSPKTSTQSFCTPTLRQVNGVRSPTSVTIQLNSSPSPLTNPCMEYPPSLTLLSSLPSFRPSLHQPFNNDPDLCCRSPAINQQVPSSCALCLPHVMATLPMRLSDYLCKAPWRARQFSKAVSMLLLLLLL